MYKIRFSVKKTKKYEFGKTGENNIEEDLLKVNEYCSGWRRFEGLEIANLNNFGKYNRCSYHNNASLKHILLAN